MRFTNYFGARRIAPFVPFGQWTKSLSMASEVTEPCPSASGLGALSVGSPQFIFSASLPRWCFSTSRCACAASFNA